MVAKFFQVARVRRLRQLFSPWTFYQFSAIWQAINLTFKDVGHAVKPLVKVIKEIFPLLNFKFIIGLQVQEKSPHFIGYFGR